jgi:hypothetical protein
MKISKFQIKRLIKIFQMLEKIDPQYLDVDTTAAADEAKEIYDEIFAELGHLLEELDP